MITIKNFSIDMDYMQGVVAWKFLGKLTLDEVVGSIKAIQEAVLDMKRKKKEIKIIIDNWDMSKDGMKSAYVPKIAEKWGELQAWFLKNLSDDDRIAVIQGGMIVKGQMSRMSAESGLSKIESHFYTNDFNVTKQQAYAHLGITSNKLIDAR